MNRRQKKKAYKKRYGHNPPEKSYVYQAYEIDIQRVVDTLADGIGRACKAITEAVAAFTENITNMWERTRESIQTMSEEEYAEFLEELEPEARGWAAAIRMGAKKENAD